MRVNRIKVIRVMLTFSLNIIFNYIHICNINIIQIFKD